MPHPPGPRGREAFGFFSAGSIGGMLRFFERTARSYGPVSSFRLLGKRIYLIDDAELVQEVLVTRQHEFVRDTGAALGRELVGDGLVTREEPLHRERRRVLQPAFHRDQIASYAAVMTGEAKRLSEGWAEKECLEIRAEMRRLTLAIVGSTLFGTDFRDSARLIAGVLERVARKGRWLAPAVTFLEPLLRAYRRFSPDGRSLFFPKERAELDRIVAPIIQERRRQAELNGGLSDANRDVLSLLFRLRSEEEEPLTSEDLTNEVVTFVLAGHETTAAALTSTWVLLLNCPAVLARLECELDEVLGGRVPEFEDVGRLPYTANVFREALRLYPPAVLFGRRPKSDLELGGYTIKRGESIFVSPYITQRNARYFERPESFEPERWDSVNIPKFAYFPFGGGAKMCIGDSFARMEGLLVLATIAQRWRFDMDHEEGKSVGDDILLDSRQKILLRSRKRVPTAAKIAH